MDKERMNEIVQGMLGKLHSVDDGTVLTSWRLLKLAGYDPDQFSFSNLLTLHTALFKAAGQEGIILDMSSHEGKNEGLPFNLEFIVKKT